MFLTRFKAGNIGKDDSTKKKIDCNEPSRAELTSDTVMLDITEVFCEEADHGQVFLQRQGQGAED